MKLDEETSVMTDGIKEKRLYPRIFMPLAGVAPHKAEILYGNGSVDVEIANISMGGAMFHSHKRFGLGNIITLSISGVYLNVAFHEHMPGKIVAIYLKEDRNSYSLQFATVLELEQTPSLAALLGHSNSKGDSFLRNPLQGKTTRKD